MIALATDADATADGSIVAAVILGAIVLAFVVGGLLLARSARRSHHGGPGRSDDGSLDRSREGDDD